MKNNINRFNATIVVLLTCCSVFSFRVFSQEADKAKPEQEMKNVFKCNPFYTFGGWVPITYERFVSPNKSIMLSVSYITNPMGWVISMIENSYPYDTRSGIYINPAMRFYLYKTHGVPGGFYASPEVGFISQTRTLKADTIESPVNTAIYPTVIDTLEFPKQNAVILEYQIAATIGWQGVINKVFTWDIYVGEGFSIVKSSDDLNNFYKHINSVYNNNKRIPKNGARLLAGFRIGIPF